MNWYIVAYLIAVAIDALIMANFAGGLFALISCFMLLIGFAILYRNKKRVWQFLAMSCILSLFAFSHEIAETLNRKKLAPVNIEYKAPEKPINDCPTWKGKNGDFFPSVKKCNYNYEVKLENYQNKLRDYKSKIASLEKEKKKAEKGYDLAFEDISKILLLIGLTFIYPFLLETLIERASEHSFKSDKKEPVAKSEKVKISKRDMARLILKNGKLSPEEKKIKIDKLKMSKSERSEVLSEFRKNNVVYLDVKNRTGGRT